MRTINTIKLSGYLESDQRGYHERNSGDLIKCLWWDGQGLCLFSKRLERGRFLWPSVGIEVGTRFVCEGIRQSDGNRSDRGRQNPLGLSSFVLANVIGRRS